MHVTAYKNCAEFAHKYCHKGMRVLDVGSMNVNGTVKPIFEGCDYVGMDIEEGSNVDVVQEPWVFPFKDNSFDCVVSTSCLEHDPKFWVTVKEMMRVSKGLIYINVPSAQSYHAYPVPWRDCVGIFKCLK